jgi:hypothetical protein
LWGCVAAVFSAIKLLGGIILFLLALAAASKSLVNAAYVGIIAGVIFGGNLLFSRWSRRRETIASQAYWKTGDREAWPFLRLEDLRQAMAHDEPDGRDAIGSDFVT